MTEEPITDWDLLKLCSQTDPKPLDEAVHPIGRAAMTRSLVGLLALGDLPWCASCEPYAEVVRSALSGEDPLWIRDTIRIPVRDLEALRDTVTRMASPAPGEKTDPTVASLRHLAERVTGYLGRNEPPT